MTICRTQLLFGITTAFILFFFVHTVSAQADTVTGDGETVSESVAVSSSPAPTQTADWYKSERISGNVEVGDFVVGPGRAEISGKPGESVTVEISVTNRISSDRVFLLEVEDIEGSRDGTSMNTLASGQKSPRGLVDFISFPNNELTLEVGERARIPVTVNIPDNASPGGYFGAVLVSTVRAAETSEDLAPRSPVIARVASLIFLTVEGEVLQSGETLEFNTINNTKNWGLWYESGPVDFGILYENTGTVHLNPYGTVSVRNLLGEEVGYVELEPWFVLPNALRLREFTWDREFLFGRYVVEANINRGYNDEIDTLTTTFWVLPWRLVGGIFIVIFLLVFAVRGFFRRFEFKRKD